MTTSSSINLQEVAKFSQLAASWWDKNGPFKTLHDINPVRLSFIKNHTPLGEQRFLDVGCGGGILTEALAKAGALAMGLDVDEAIIQAAKQHAVDQALSISYVCCPLETYEAPLFDAITCMEMLEHVDDPKKILGHCARLLKPNGLLFLSTINRTLKAYGAAIIGAEYLLKILPKQTHDYQKFIKPSELVSMARTAHLELLDLQGMGYNPWTRQAYLQPDVSVNYLLCFKKGSY